MVDEQWLWQRIREEAKESSEREPMLASFFHSQILNHADLRSALSFAIAAKLSNDVVPSMLIREVFVQAMAEDSSIAAAACADVEAHFERDPACDQYLIPLLYFKGYQAIQAYRVAHWLWQCGRHSMALFLQNRIATVFDVDIHPAAVIGRGLMVDHATGVVIGETAVIGDDVSMLHSVTLGGCGSGAGVRHPQVGNGVLISTGSKILGDVRIGDGAKIAAGSLVLESVAAHTTVAGVPARVVGRPKGEQPSRDMNQNIDN